jgi:nicotinamide N-methyltransferase
MASEADEESLDLFQEPADFYEPEKQATFASHQLLSGKELTVRLVGHNPLWVRHHYRVFGVQHRPLHRHC